MSRSDLIPFCLSSSSFSSCKLKLAFLHCNRTGEIRQQHRQQQQQRSAFCVRRWAGGGGACERVFAQPACGQHRQSPMLPPLLLLSLALAGPNSATLRNRKRNETKRSYDTLRRATTTTSCCRSGCAFVHPQAHIQASNADRNALSHTQTHAETSFGQQFCDGASANLAWRWRTLTSALHWAFKRRQPAAGRRFAHRRTLVHKHTHSQEAIAKWAEQSRKRERKTDRQTERAPLRCFQSSVSSSSPSPSPPLSSSSSLPTPSGFHVHHHNRIYIEPINSNLSQTLESLLDIRAEHHCRLPPTDPIISRIISVIISEPGVGRASKTQEELGNKGQERTRANSKSRRRQR